MTLPSWHAKTNTSKIVTMINDGVTSFQNSFVVTEQGIAECFGHNESEQAKNLIEKAAHPDARSDLRIAAKKMGL